MLTEPGPSPVDPASQWDMPVGATVGPAGSTVTLVQSSSFCISEYAGDVMANTTQGLYFRDVRILSRYEMLVDGGHAESLSTAQLDPFSAVFGSRVPSAQGSDSTVLVVRHRYVGRGMREDVIVRNFGDDAAPCSLALLVESDFAHLFEVKGGRIPPRPRPEVAYDAATRTLHLGRADDLHAVRLTTSQPAQPTGDGLRRASTSSPPAMARSRRSRPSTSRSPGTPPSSPSPTPRPGPQATSPASR